MQQSFNLLPSYYKPPGTCNELQLHDFLLTRTDRAFELTFSIEFENEEKAIPKMCY